MTHGGTPLLVLDTWEHAFYLQYQNQKGEFFEAVWNRRELDDRTTRFERARGASLELAGAGS